jgi:hypothetical protein
MTIPIVYLACPYTDPNPAVRLGRYKLATRAAAYIATHGYVVYSPITMTHPMDIIMGGMTKKPNSNYWYEFDEAFMEVCTRMIVLMIDGWESSKGVKREIDFFDRKRRQIIYLPTDELRKPWSNILELRKYD